ncbi:hypothetical protein CHS0354_012445 [Potamilus streckersoni]|uniref:Uncharacterized protein n=1 Tax=Potamilus streckersoni TaxID=2493646 RepID=A0AAE0RVK9_9BIVA|nr:hypothetical protein CHS0354_012445 [Potamilus streckersoni]
MTNYIPHFFEAKGLDGRGVRRGKCKGCNDCNQFKGDLKCAYCNCTAAQHVNLTVGAADYEAGTSKSKNMPKSIGTFALYRVTTLELFIYIAQKGKCKGCNECDQFKGDLKCDYCNCTAAQHINLAVRAADNDVGTSTSETMSKPNGLDGRGVQRGKCKGCNDCNQFEGDLKCEYCNCTAAQHVNLTVGAADYEAGTSTSERMPKTKGLDGRGVRRGKCKGCNECDQFKGDLKCDYCNCTAAQHVNLAVGAADYEAGTSTSESMPKTKGLDGRGVRRGKCKGCNECDQFKGDLKCDYCNCTAAQHINLAVRAAGNDVGTSTSETMSKSNGLDGRGVQRGHCKGCNDCNQFKGDLKCEYCNCTAAQHVNLAVGAADYEAGTSTSERMPKTKALDGRGVRRGKCKGCNDCNQFKGDLKCEYCNCTAAQHVNLAVRAADYEAGTSTSESVPKTKGLDGRGVRRGKCKGCNDCNQFKGDLKCEYCNCTAAQHVNLAVRAADKEAGRSETMRKIHVIVKGFMTRYIAHFFEAKGLDGRGVRRGKCKGCNECDQFKGDLKCDYCNCTAAQHVNLAVRAADYEAGTILSETVSKCKL